MNAGRLASRWVGAAGGLMHARVSIEPLPPGAPAVVLVHGLVISSRYMVPLAERLAPSCRVLAPDLPGFGRSFRPERVLGVPELADALADWMAAAGVPRAALLGNSFGCQVAVECAVRHPARVARLVLQAPTVDPGARSFWRQLPRWLADSPGERRSLDRLMLRDFWTAGPRRVIGTMRAMLRDRIEEKLPRLRMPVLVVRGGRDPLVPTRWAEEAARLVPNGRLVVVPGAPHAMNYSASLELARVVRPFLAEEALDRGRGAVA